MKSLFSILRSVFIISFLLFISSCRQQIPKISPIPTWTTYDETTEIAANANHEHTRMRYKLIQSKILDKNKIWKNITAQIGTFGEVEYQRLKPLILEKSIVAIQNAVLSKQLTYEQLTQWYLYRIMKFENDKDKTLHSIIAINPQAVAQARQKDKAIKTANHPIYGIPILVKDNINTKDMPTTAGAEVLKNHQPIEDAFIIKQIKQNGGIILGKVNLSEWAYYFCEGCPLGYSAVGGQTLNPYGRKIFETGGSSAGSGTTMAANYAAAAIGTETAGSILSPSSQNSIVGLKPTIGVLSRSGIVPISSSLDTPGPMTKTVHDNAILLSAMSGKDIDDEAQINYQATNYTEKLGYVSFKDLRFGAFKKFMENPIYKKTMDKLIDLGATVIVTEASDFDFKGFTTFLNADMKVDIPKYFEKNPTKNDISTVADIVSYNLKDTLIRSPYGQKHFENIVAETIGTADFEKLKNRFLIDARNFFDKPMNEHELDVILSINNWNAGHAAMAKYPCLTIPMGYQESGEPLSLTFIAKPFEEAKLLNIGTAFERETQVRKIPKGYE